MWANKAFRVWCFGSALWIVAWSITMPVFQPFGGYISPREFMAAWVIALVPLLVGAAVYVYRRYIA